MSKIQEIQLFEQIDFRYSNLPNGALDIRTARNRFTEASGPATDSYPTIYPQFHVLTADKPTRNKTFYTLKSHKGKLDESTHNGSLSTGQHSFTKPYQIPLIKEHNTGGGFFGGDASDTYGRIIRAKVVSNKDTGIKHLAALGEVTHKEAIEEILTGRWLTGSLGSAVREASCNVCGQPLNDMFQMSEHEHQRGKFYAPSREGGWEEVSEKDKRGQMAVLVIDEYAAREYSKVLVPSDDASQVTTRDTTQGGGNFGSPLEGESCSMSLWVPMGISASENIGTFGERFVDLTTGIQLGHEFFGLPCGDALHERLESIHKEKSGATPSESTLSFFQDKEDTTEESDCGCNSTQKDKDENTEEKPLTTTGRNKLASKTPKAFCGPGNSFPVHDKAHYLAARRLLGRYKGDGKKSEILSCIMRKGRQNGWAPKETFKENILTPKNPKGTHALELVYNTVEGNAQSFSFLPRGTAEERTKCLSIIENAEVFPFLSEEQEETLKSLFSESSTGQEDAIAFELEENNYPLLIMLSTLSNPVTPTVETNQTEAITNLETKFNEQLSAIQEQLATLVGKSDSTDPETTETTEETTTTTAPVDNTTEETPDMEYGPIVKTYKLAVKQLGKESLSDTELKELSDEEVLTKIQELYQDASSATTTGEHDDAAEGTKDTSISELGVENPLVEEGTNDPEEGSTETESTGEPTVNESLDKESFDAILDAVHSLRTGN